MAAAAGERERWEKEAAWRLLNEWREAVKKIAKVTK